MLRADRTREPAQSPLCRAGRAVRVRQPRASEAGPIRPWALAVRFEDTKPVESGDERTVVQFRRSKAGYLSVSGKVNGRPVNLMVDTGAPTSRLDPGEPRAPGRGVETLRARVPEHGPRWPAI